MSDLVARIGGALHAFRKRVRRLFCKHPNMTDSRRFNRKATCIDCGHREPW